MQNKIVSNLVLSRTTTDKTQPAHHDASNNAIKERGFYPPRSDKPHCLLPHIVPSSELGKAMFASILITGCVFQHRDRSKRKHRSASFLFPRRIHPRSAYYTRASRRKIDREWKSIPQIIQRSRSRYSHRPRPPPYPNRRMTAQRISLRRLARAIRRRLPFHRAHISPLRPEQAAPPQQPTPSFTSSEEQEETAQRRNAIAPPEQDEHPMHSPYSSSYSITNSPLSLSSPLSATTAVNLSTPSLVSTPSTLSTPRTATTPTSPTSTNTSPPDSPDLEDNIPSTLGLLHLLNPYIYDPFFRDDGQSRRPSIHDVILMCRAGHAAQERRRRR